MKKLLLISLCSICSVSVCKSQTGNNPAINNPKYLAVMKENIAPLDTTTTPENFAILANNFERIALAEKNDWLSWYYASYCFISQASKLKDKDLIDQLAEKAESRLKKADSLSRDNSEIYCLKYQLCYIKIKADPMGRYQQYTTLANEYIKKAKALNKDNPRVWLCEAQVIFRTPEAFGGGAKAAKPLAEEMMRKFEAFVPQSEILPNWGKKSAQKLWDEINKQ